MARACPPGASESGADVLSQNKLHHQSRRWVHQSSQGPGSRPAKHHAEFDLPLPIFLAHAPQQDNTFLKTKTIDSLLQMLQNRFKQSTSAIDIYQPLKHLYFDNITKAIQPLLNILHKRYPSMILLPQKTIPL